MTDYKEKLTITFEHNEGTEEFSITREGGLANDEAFWSWFVDVWPALGLNFIKEGIQEND